MIYIPYIYYVSEKWKAYISHVQSSFKKFIIEFIYEIQC
jgi:hypothetical protein